MKKNVFYTSLICMMFSCTSIVYSQNDEIQVIGKLKNFYTAYNKVWEKKSTPSDLMNRLDSLHQIYCTVKLRVELRNLFNDQGLDHDIFTNDYGTNDESIKSLIIIKDTMKTNSYIVSYFINTENPKGKMIKKKVVINLELKKENGIFKINDVK